MNLVVGGTGLVGSHILLELTSIGAPVKALKRAQSDTARVKSLFEFYQNVHFDKIEWIEGDILDIVSLENAFEGISNLYHAAGMVNFNKKNRDQLFKVNIEGTHNVVNAALHCGVKKIGFVSSIAALGPNKDSKIIDENNQWKISKENSDYSVAKFNAEREIWRSTEEGIEAVIINPSIIIGPGNWNSGSSTLFKVVNDGLSFYTKGENGYVDVRDVAKTLVLLVNSDTNKERFICSSENLKHQEVIEYIAQGLNKKAPTKYASPFLTGIGWRLATMGSWISGKAPSLTKASAKSSHEKFHFSNQKISEKLDYQFIKIENSCQHAARFYLNHRQ